MDDHAFDARAHDELAYLEDRLGALDPDDVELTVSAGVLRVDLRDGTRIVINSHRAAGQIWMAAIATAWHFDPLADGRWLASRSGEELRSTLARLIRERAGVDVAL
ncbi:MAG: iron donor protein CyaY [Kofleriaceae bacterium]|nr:iron donor protein CyaY [Kofleriaceae bacterium]MCL4226094.1 iron donor protein CyaY [Myxococcales bacterium]